MALLRHRRTSPSRRASTADVADVRPWPHDPTVAHLVLLDSSRTPSVEQIEALTRRTLTDDPSLRAIRTSALFPGPRDHFAQAGYEVADRLALLERPVDRVDPIQLMRRDAPDVEAAIRLGRLTPRRLPDAARIDLAAFPDGWANTATTLGDIASATPRHHSRVALRSGTAVGFAITGLAGTTGYLQRLAVHPDHHRQGIARLLVDDLLGWLQRRGASTVLVNTGVDNDAALQLYRSMGFRDRRDELVIMQRARQSS